MVRYSIWTVLILMSSLYILSAHQVYTSIFKIFVQHMESTSEGIQANRQISSHHLRSAYSLYAIMKKGVAKQFVKEVL